MYLIILQILPTQVVPQLSVQNLECIYIFEHNLYISDVKVSPEGRCSEVLL